MRKFNCLKFLFIVSPVILMLQILFGTLIHERIKRDLNKSLLFHESQITWCSGYYIFFTWFSCHIFLLTFTFFWRFALGNYKTGGYITLTWNGFFQFELRHRRTDSVRLENQSQNRSGFFLDLVEYAWSSFLTVSYQARNDYDPTYIDKCSEIVFNTTEQDSNTYNHALINHQKCCKVHKIPAKLSSTKKKPCDWKMLRLRLDPWKLNSIDFENLMHIEDLILLQKMNVHFLTRFSYAEPTQYDCLLNCLQKFHGFDTLFMKMYVYIIESLIIREDGILLINQLLKNLQSSYLKIMVQNQITKKTFQNWPPPLWFHSLIKLRLMIRKNLNSLDLKYCAEDITSFIYHPMNIALFDIFQLLNLSFKDIWITEKYGIFQNLQSTSNLDS